MNSVCGFLLIDKPEQMTSMSAARRVKKILNVDHVGNLGTLDPFASGLLPVLVGGAARLADFAHEGLKTYEFTVSLGRETDTLDPLGQVIGEAPVPGGVLQLIPTLLPRFTGEIRQVPPAYSAIKMDGAPLYEHMRSSGVLPRDLETKTRTVWIDRLEFLACRDEGSSSCELDFRVSCGKGTYIRSLARDIAAALGTRGYCRSLRRTLIVPWSVADAIDLFGAHKESSREQLLSFLRPPAELAPALPILSLGVTHKRLFAAGNPCVVRDSVKVVRLGQPEAAASFCLVECEEILFLCEVEGDAVALASNLQDGGTAGFELRPRKRIC